MTSRASGWFSSQGMVIALVALAAAGCRGAEDRLPANPVVRLASWGGRFQDDLVRLWVEPAARQCELELQTQSWNGDYAALTARIQRGVNDWDVVHVEAHYVANPFADSLFEAFPGRRLSTALPTLAGEPRAVPVLEYGYLLAFRRDLLNIEHSPDWSVFFESSLAGRRGVRDFPVGNIEAALLALGRSPQTALYAQSLSRSEVERQVRDALSTFDRIKPLILWWQSGDQLQQMVTTGDVVMAAAWSGRVLSARRSLCSTDGNCAIDVNPRTALVSTDWWVIPRGASGAPAANELLQCLFGESAGPGAQAFSEAQGYRAPMANLTFSDPVVARFLDVGSAANPDAAARIDEAFWSRNFEWISREWNAWRVR